MKETLKKIGNWASSLMVIAMFLYGIYESTANVTAFILGGFSWENYKNFKVSQYGGGTYEKDEEDLED